MNRALSSGEKDPKAPALSVSPLTNRVYVVTKWQRPGIAAKKLDVTEDFDRLVRNTHAGVIAERDEAQAEAKRLREPIPDASSCQRCGRQDGVDAVVPNDVWQQISPKGNSGGLLCLWCIDELCAERGIECKADLHFAGRAVRASTVPEAHDDIREALAVARDPDPQVMRAWIVQQGYTAPDTDDLYELSQRVLQITRGELGAPDA